MVPRAGVVALRSLANEHKCLSRVEAARSYQADRRQQSSAARHLLLLSLPAFPLPLPPPPVQYSSAPPCVHRCSVKEDRFFLRGVPCFLLRVWVQG